LIGSVPLKPAVFQITLADVLPPDARLGTNALPTYQSPHPGTAAKNAAVNGPLAWLLALRTVACNVTVAPTLTEVLLVVRLSATRSTMDVALAVKSFIRKATAGET